MLTLTRKKQQEIVIGPDIVVRVVRLSGHRVQLGIDAPPEVRIQRDELLEEKKPAEEGEQAS
ncbi:MAG: carbon storage regulator [Selenomonas sp.]|nr:carbon storage regulator [Selenomonas sp.]MCI7329902.1 carbon storage regulator [Selenomonadaceae bacterium]MDD6120347.1 carbon storage regulator [Selenomonadaceae bacterium]MDY3915868.1 carbon storage regulator [Selenomonadaceae bacterium]HBT79567.1 carbon storage regulator [Selenomonas sp.]